MSKGAGAIQWENQRQEKEDNKGRRRADFNEGSDAIGAAAFGGGGHGRGEVFGQILLEDLVDLADLLLFLLVDFAGVLKRNMSSRLRREGRGGGRREDERDTV